MALNQIAPPYPVFCDTDGTPLDAGYIYIGDSNTNPETNPVPVFWDTELSLPAPQPIRTINGYPSRYGTPAQLYVDGLFSITVRDVNKALVFYAPVGTGVTAGAVASTTIQRFSGTGTQTGYTLSSLPGDSNGVDVFINGVYQQKNTYTVVGTLLTFSEAPIVGTANIEVIVHAASQFSSTAQLAADLLAADALKGSALVRFLQMGLGVSTVRTVQDKLRDTYSAKDFGAVGDGIADDTTAIQAAVATGGVVYFPEGTYLMGNAGFTGTLRLRGSSRRAVTIKWKNASAESNLFALSGAVDVLVENITFDSNRQNQTDSTGYYGVFGGTVSDGSQLVFRGCEFKNGRINDIILVGPTATNSFAHWRSNRALSRTVWSARQPVRLKRSLSAKVSAPALSIACSVNPQARPVTVELAW